MPTILRLCLVSIAGAAFGLLMIRLGFNLRFGGYGSTWWLSAPDAYIPSAIVGAVIAILIDYTIRKRVN